MPRGRGRGGHKGQRRHFTNPDELAVEKEKEERERKWREQRGEISSDDEEEEEESKSSSSSSEEEDCDELDKGKAKGVHHLIDIENPNRVMKKDKKIAQLNETEEAPELSRREREELERQKARAHYMKLHAAGKTAEAKADLARLALIRKQREDAAKKRDEEKLAKEAATAAKAEEKIRSLGKKS